MKKIFSLLLLTTAYVIICSAQDVRIDSVYHSFFVELYGHMVNKTIYSYDEKGQKVKEELYFENGDRWNLSKITIFRYNDNGTLNKKMWYSPSSKQSYTKEIYLYKDTLLVRKELQSSNDSLDWKTYRYWTYQHNKDNRRIRESTYKNDSIEDSRVEYLYDVMGNVAQEKKYELNKGNIECYQRIEYIYNADNQLITEKDFREGKKIKRQNTYEYDAKGNLVQKYEYMLFEEIFKPLCREQYENNLDGKPILKLHYSFDERNGWGLNFKYIISYDIYGNMTNKSAYLNIQNTWIPSDNDENWIYFYTK